MSSTPKTATASTSKAAKSTETTLQTTQYESLKKMIESLAASVGTLTAHTTKVDTQLTSLEERFNSFGTAVEEKFKEDTTRLDNMEKQSLESIEDAKGKVAEYINTHLQGQRVPKTPRDDDGDVVMRDSLAPQPEPPFYFHGEAIEVNTFIDRCRSHFYRYASRYLYDEQAKVYYVTDRLRGNAALWYQATQKEAQKQQPDVEKLFEKMKSDFQLEEDKELMKSKLLKLKHEWGKVYDYLAEFNRLTRAIGCSEEQRKGLLN